LQAWACHTEQLLCHIERLRGNAADAGRESAAELLANTIGTISAVLRGGHQEIERLIAKEGTDQGAFPDYLYVIERTWVGAVRLSNLPTNLPMPALFDFAGAGGLRFREPTQLHCLIEGYRVVVSLRLWATKMYPAVCQYLGIKNPELLPIDPELPTLAASLWTTDSENLLFRGEPQDGGAA
jgi:hypothetical protein